jgi:hypothetical protein
MAVAIVLGLVPAAFAGTTLQVKSRPLRESAQLKYSSSDALAGLTKGAGTGSGTISARVFVRPDGVTTGYTIPAGSHDGSAGWIVNDAQRTLFANRVAYVVTNGAETLTHCTQFAPGTCTFTPLRSRRT